MGCAIATTKSSSSALGWSDSPNRSAPRGEERETEFECAVADAIRGAYRADGAAEDTETFVEMGELGMFGVFVAARPKSEAGQSPWLTGWVDRSCEGC